MPELPDEPLLLSYLVAASMILDLPVRQDLLAEPDAERRLGAERALLARETTMLRSLTATPAPDLRNTPYNPELTVCPAYGYRVVIAVRAGPRARQG